MRYEHLGIDQTQANPVPFVDLTFPTDATRVQQAMQSIIEAKYPGIHILQLDMWRKVGLGGSVIYDWIQRLILLERQRQESLSLITANTYQSLMQAQYQDYAAHPDDLSDYIDAYLQLLDAGQVPATIREPWTYTPTTTGQDIANVVAGGVKAAQPIVWGGLVPLVAVAVGVYAVINLAPSLGTKLLSHKKG